MESSQRPDQTALAMAAAKLFDGDAVAYVTDNTRQVTAVALIREAIRRLGWGTMRYRCEACNYETRIWVALGVEGPPALKKVSLYVACPFTVSCWACAWPPHGRTQAARARERRPEATGHGRAEADRRPELTIVLRNQVIRRYLAGESIREIAETVPMSRSGIQKWLIQAGVPRRPRGGVPSTPHVVFEETVWLYESGLSMAEVGRRMGVSEQAVRDRLELAGVPRRSRREARALYLERRAA